MKKPRTTELPDRVQAPIRSTHSKTVEHMRAYSRGEIQAILVDHARREGCDGNLGPFTLDQHGAVLLFSKMETVS